MRRGAMLTAVLLALIGLTGCGGRGENESVVEGVPLMQLNVTGESPALTFRWTAVPGATAYEVVVLDDAGHAAWSWTGAATSVDPPDHATIPAKGSATVAAFDAKRTPIGLSDPVTF